MLKHAAPLAGPVLGVASEHLANQLAYETRLMTELISKLPVPEGFGADLPQVNDPRRIELHVDYRALHALLHELDPSDHWAGELHLHPRREVLWLCSDHVQQYSA